MPPSTTSTSPSWRGAPGGLSLPDLGGLFHTTRRQLELGERYTGAGLSAVLGIGSCPGIANVHAGDLGSRLDEVRSVRIFNGATVDPSIGSPGPTRCGRSSMRSPSARWSFATASSSSWSRYPRRSRSHSWSRSATPPISSIRGGHHPGEPGGEGDRALRVQDSVLRVVRAALRKLAFLASIGLASTDPRTVGDAQAWFPAGFWSTSWRHRRPHRSTPGSRTSPPWQREPRKVSPPGSGWTQRHGRRPSWASAGDRGGGGPTRRGRPLAAGRRHPSRCPPTGDGDRTAALLRATGPPRITTTLSEETVLAG